MRKIALFLTFLSVLSLPIAAQAEPKTWPWIWWTSHWDDVDFKPYLMDPKEPHNSQWRATWNQDHDWSPEKWIEAEGSVEAIMANFYNMNIIKEQTEDRNIPVLIVGDGFMRLSGEEKRHVAELIDYVFAVTEREENAYFTIYYDRTKRLFSRGEPIGVYTENGLQLQ